MRIAAPLPCDPSPPNREPAASCGWTPDRTRRSTLIGCQRSAAAVPPERGVASGARGPPARGPPNCRRVVAAEGPLVAPPVAGYDAGGSQSGDNVRRPVASWPAQGSVRPRMAWRGGHEPPHAAALPTADSAAE